MKAFKTFCVEASFNTKIYGAWVDPKGKIHDIKDKFGHEDFINMHSDRGANRFMPGTSDFAFGSARFRDAFYEGWVRITFEFDKVILIEGTKKAIKKHFEILFDTPSNIVKAKIDIVNKKGYNMKAKSYNWDRVFGQGTAAKVKFRKDFG